MNERGEYIGKQIKALRLRYGMSQLDLATKLGVSDSIISGYERGTRKPSMKMLINLSEIFGVPTSYFLEQEVLKNPDLMVNMTDLTNEQFKIILELVHEFIELNAKTRNIK